MGDKLLRFYKEIGDMQGLNGKMKLAQETKIPSAKAAFEPDSNENIQLFIKAFEKLTGKPAPRF